MQDNEIQLGAPEDGSGEPLGFLRRRDWRRKIPSKRSIRNIAQSVVDQTTDSSRPTEETTATQLAGSSMGSTEDSWITLNSGLVGKRFAWVEFAVDGNADTQQGTLSYRTRNGSQEIAAVRMIQDSQAHNELRFVTLTSDGKFDVKADTTLGNFTWAVNRVGYW